MGKNKATAEAPLQGGIADEAARREKLAALGLGINVPNSSAAPGPATEPSKPRMSPSNEERWDQLQRNEAYGAALRANDPHEQRVERRRLAKIEIATGEAVNERNFQLLLLEVGSLTSKFNQFGSGVSSEATGEQNTFRAEAEDQVFVMAKLAQNEAIAKVIVELRARLPELRDKVQAHQNRYLKQLAEKREADEEEREKRSAAGMSPTQCIELLRKEGITIRLGDDGKIEAAPANRLDRRVRALLRINENGIVDLLRSQQEFTRVG